MLSSVTAYVVFYVFAAASLATLCASVTNIYHRNFDAGPVYGMFSVGFMLTSWCVAVGAGL